jgi:2-oxoglutarate ferredoxin oxidoreductase subunit alpha
VVDTDTFDKRNIEKAGFEDNPLEDGTLDNYNVIECPLTSLNRESLKDLGLDNKSMTRCKNMFALGIVYWMFNRPLKQTIAFLEKKFKGKDAIIEANKKALHAGHSYADTIEALTSSYTVLPAHYEKGTYRNISGNQAVAWGLLAASQNSSREIFFGSYPITPASDILHELAKHKHFGAKIFQAEDEIAAICSALGASFAGSLAVTSTSGPGLALKTETIGLAVISELPLVIIDVQRGGPSTGLPTKTEQSDLLQALFGRNGECPAIVVAASTPGNCFQYAYEAARLSMEHMTPVLLLTDGYLGNGAAPWRIKSLKDMTPINPPIIKKNPGDWKPYMRDPKTLARQWAIPGTPGLEHRLGGLEKQDITGNVSYDPENHEKMSKIRAEKVERVADNIPDLKVDCTQEGDLLVVGWGGTYGHLLTAVTQLNQKGKSVGLAHFNYINPLPRNTEEVFSRFKKIVVCELNLGQFVVHLRSKFPQFDFMKYNKVQGLPFTVAQLYNVFNQLLETKTNGR